MWFNKQSEEKQREMNDMFQQYKKNEFKIGVAEVTTEGIKQAEIIEPAFEEFIEIEAEPITMEEWLEYKTFKAERNKRVFRKFGVEYER